MTEAIVCAVIAAIAAVTVGIINALSQKKTKQDLSAEFQKELQEAREKERARQKYEVYMIKGIMASNTLSEATARAVQRIPDAHCNGDMETALEEEEKVKKEIQLFLAKQGVNNIIT
ncbi:MAG: serine/threonine protein kinase [Ruminococcus sp.]|nr:serine/threonine protein kinase [Ruminococcus sp.]